LPHRILQVPLKSVIEVNFKQYFFFHALAPGWTLGGSMTIRSGAVVLSSLLLLVFAGPAAGQAMVEYGVAGAAAANSAGALKGLSNTVNGVFGNLDKVMKEGQAPEAPAPIMSPSGPATTSRPSSRSNRQRSARPSSGSVAPVAAPAPPPPNYEDPRQIQAGMGYDEVVRRFGPPSLQFTSGWSSKTVTYLSKTGPVQVEVEDGKVTSAPKTKS
jgi:hypothetical protein